MESAAIISYILNGALQRADLVPLLKSSWISNAENPARIFALVSHFLIIYQLNSYG
jgi:hypothetical protein